MNTDHAVCGDVIFPLSSILISLEAQPENSPSHESKDAHGWGFVHRLYDRRLDILTNSPLFHLSFWLLYGTEASPPFRNGLLWLMPWKAWMESELTHEKKKEKRSKTDKGFTPGSSRPRAHHYSSSWVPLSESICCSISPLIESKSLVRESLLFGRSA